jgi:hypothetical protein
MNGKQHRKQQRARSGVGLSLALWIAAGAGFDACRPVPAHAQSAAPEVVPRVALAELNGTPGSSLMVPLYFTPDPKNPVRSITVDIEFVSNNLKFDHASKGTAAEQSGAELTTAVTEGKPDDKNVTRSKLRITAAIADAASKTGLPDGLLAYMLFQISLDAKPFSIRLTPTVIDATDVQNKKVAKVGTEPGLVVVEVLDVQPENTCFFFTH